MNLIVDIGNSRRKIYMFEGRKLIKKEIINLPELSDTELLKKLIKVNNPENCILSSTKRSNISYNDIFLQLPGRYIELNPSTPIPIINGYSTPQTLGSDRLAAACAVFELNKGEQSLIIDAGTAMTIDFVDKKGIFTGGFISPGLRMRIKALHEYTDKLPVTNPDTEYNFPATNTVEAITGGVVNGMIYELESYINNFVKNGNKGMIFLTGGDCYFFEKRLKSIIFAEPNLVAIGLNEILLHNIN